MDHWGSVPGDVNAQAIISDRRTAKKIAPMVSLILGALFPVAAIAYGVTKDPQKGAPNCRLA